MKKGRLNLCIDDKICEALRFIAKEEHRSLNNMIEILIVKECISRRLELDSLEEKAPA